MRWFTWSASFHLLWLSSHVSSCGSKGFCVYDACCLCHLCHRPCFGDASTWWTDCGLFCNLGASSLLFCRYTRCFPSLHVAVAFLSAFAILKVDRFVGAFTLILAALIAVSTMMIKQHFFADVVFGFALSELSRRLFLSKIMLRSDEMIDKAPGRKGALIVMLIYSLCLLCMYVSYRSGWEPWR